MFQRTFDDCCDSRTSSSAHTRTHHTNTRVFRPVRMIKHRGIKASADFRNTSELLIRKKSGAGEKRIRSVFTMRAFKP